MSNPTKAERARFQRFQSMGCIVSRLYLHQWMAADVHHITDCGRRLGHSFTLPLNPWTHRAVPPNGMTERQAYLELGPTLEKHKREFVQRYGGELFLLEQVNLLLGVDNE